MADPQAHLDHLDRLMGDLGRALAEKDWDAMAGLNEQVKPAVEPLMAALEAGEDPESLNAGDWQRFENQGRDGANLSRFVVQRAFAMPRPDEGNPSMAKAVGQREAAIILVDAVNEGAVDTDGAEYQQLRQFLAQLEGQREYMAYQQYLRNTAEVDRD